ncbi:hypothetical protein [Vibrio sp. 99-70-13A1]|uniref:hypothetical protein n=1 Tax=Vibrio sp. 99-70-13A1 TaxID=2607601 RepID=UPI0014937A8B|nr:hypothetical protein [Vibrio sp. 99-70-13A1]NOH97757.1 hypothetical protein [Vibrio sp. 99-70-13A1]
MECRNSLVLEANARIKLLEFMVSAIIGSDSTHIYFGVRIDVKKQIFEINTHLSVQSGIYATYRWPILQSTLQENRYLELPGKGLVSILNKVGVKEPVWLGLPNEKEIYIAAYEEDHPSQMSIFEEIIYTPKITNMAATRYSIQVIEHRKLNEYDFIFYGDECSFQVDAVALFKELRLIEQLAKEGSDITSNDRELTLEPKITDSLNYISLYSRKYQWFSTQDIDIQYDTQKGVCNGVLAHVNLSALSKLTGLLSQISGLVRIDICQSHLSFSRGQWQCAFRQTQPHWDASSFAEQFRSLDDEYFHSFSAHNLKATLESLNVANDVKKARLHIKQHVGSEFTTLSLTQDHVHSSINYPMPIPPNTLTTPISLSLWSLASLLDSSDGKVRWYFDTKNSRIIFTDDARRKHFVLQLKEE